MCQKNILYKLLKGKKVCFIVLAVFFKFSGINAACNYSAGENVAAKSPLAKESQSHLSDKD